MARCFCGGTGSCECTIEAGDGITVTGTGSEGDPYIVTAAPAVGNIVALDTTTIDMTVTGSGTGGDPWTISADLITEAVHDLIGGAFGQGLFYNDAGNTHEVMISTDANNALIFGTDSGLYVQNLGAVSTSPLAGYVNGFTAYAGATEYEPKVTIETGADHVRYRGRILTDATPTAAQVIANAPAGFRPARTVQLSVMADDGTQVALDFEPGGDIICQTTGTYGSFSLDGVTFYIGAN